MPVYGFICTDCNIEFEVILKMNDLHVGECPCCDKITNNRVYTPFSVHNATPSTLGGLADKNRKELGSYGYDDTIQKMANERRVNKFCGKTREGIVPETVERPTNIPPWRTDLPHADVKLLKATPDQITNYVNTGKRPFGT